MRVAVVGAGPKGLFATERLAAHLVAAGTAADITLFDAQPPGWGAGYHPDQPDFLRLNVDSGIVTIDGAPPGQPSLGLTDFSTWRLTHDEVEPLDPFPPRSLVGRYFACCWRELVHRVPPSVHLRHTARRVERLTPSHEGWLVDGAPFDEVLLCTGHAADWPGALRHQWHGPQSLVPQVYPVTDRLTADAVPAGCTVVCRGAALTFIDALLTLTEGRGGRFDENGYHRSGGEPARILPVARRGAFLQVKPARNGPLAALNLAAARAGGLARCAAANGDVSVVLGAVQQTAASYLATASGREVTLPATEQDPVEALSTSLEVALGTQPPGQQWALGQAWRDLYPAIVDALGHQHSSADEWQRFADFAAAMEPLAFGPPTVNAAKLLALCRAGVVDAGYLNGRWGEALQTADVVIDCVLPPPGLIEGQSPGSLVDDGLLTQATGRRGVAVAPDACCLAFDGTRIRGLSALGRPTEDVVIGNDTLSRSLHSAADLWAERVARIANEEPDE